MDLFLENCSFSPDQPVARLLQKIKILCTFFGNARKCPKGWYKYLYLVLCTLYSVFWFKDAIFRIPYSVFRIPYSVFRIPYFGLHFSYRICYVTLYYQCTLSSISYILLCSIFHYFVCLLIRTGIIYINVIMVTLNPPRVPALPGTTNS